MTTCPRTFVFLAACALLQALAPSQGLFVPGGGEPGSLASTDRRHVQAHPAVVQGLLQIRGTITDGAAATELSQILQNRTPTPQEAWWLLPLPQGAVADRFAMTVGGVETKGEVLDADKARGIYEDIVRRRRDPGLLEYLGCGLLRARVFPIPPNGQVEVKVRYAELLPETGGVTTWRFPLRAAWLDGRGPGKLGLQVEIRSKTAIKTIWSPLQELDIRRDGDHLARLGLELDGDATPPRDLAVHYGLADQDFGAHVLTYRCDGQDGYFLAMLAPKREWPEPPGLVRSINLVIDTSGSMKGEKIVQARAAVRSFLQSLAADDWFNVIPFSTDARPYFDEPVLATKENVATALQRTAALEAVGGTNIEDALAMALQRATPDCYKKAEGQELVPLCVFVTDGLPTIGTTDIEALLLKAWQQNSDKARVFAFGVGDDVNTRLLDTLARQSRGDRDYVRPGQDIELATSTLFAKLHGPALTDVTLAIDGLEVHAVEPRDLPDLFVQGQVVVLGRYRGAGQHALRLCGKVGKERHQYVFEADFPAAATQNDWLPSLWAQQRIAALLDAIRLNGKQEELVAEVTRLGREHGIVTPFTSHLVVEDSQRIAGLRGVQLGFAPGADAAEFDRVRSDWARSGAPAPAGSKADLPELGRRAQAEAISASRALDPQAQTGATAVDQSVAIRKLAEAELHDAKGASALLTRRVAGRVFHLAGGVWVDQGMTKERNDGRRRITAFGEDYFALLRAHPEVAPFLAFSTRIVVVLADGSAVEIVTAE